jgi:hypothetical protein
MAQLVEQPKANLVYRKYQALSIEGPIEAKNGKMFFKGLFEEDASDNGGYTSQSRGYVKNFFEDTHSLIYARCEKHQANETIPVRIIAAKDSVKVRPFKMFDKDGKIMINTATNEQAIGEHLSIFLMPDENAENEIRRRSRTLQFVDIVDDEEEETPETSKEKVVAGKK